MRTSWKSYRRPSLALSVSVCRRQSSALSIPFRHYLQHHFWCSSTVSLFWQLNNLNIKVKNISELWLSSGRAQTRCWPMAQHFFYCLIYRLSRLEERPRTANPLPLVTDTKYTLFILISHSTTHLHDKWFFWLQSSHSAQHSQANRACNTRDGQHRKSYINFGLRATHLNN